LRIIVCEKYIQQNLAKFSQILGILNNTFQLILAQKISKNKICNALAVPNLLYGNGTWTFGKKDKKRLTSMEMKFFRTVGYTIFDHKRKEEF